MEEYVTVIKITKGTTVWSKGKFSDESQRIFPLKGSKELMGASLVTQWLRICLPMQGTRVQALVWEDPTCRGAARPVSHNY